MLNIKMALIFGLGFAVGAIASNKFTTYAIIKCLDDKILKGEIKL